MENYIFRMVCSKMPPAVAKKRLINQINFIKKHRHMRMDPK